MRENLIEIKDLEQTFSSGDETLHVIRDVTFALKKNSFNIIFGQSGSGKSTLLNVLSGLQKPSKGRVIFEGQELYSRTQDELARFRADTIGIVYQTNYWVKSLSVIENVSLPLYFLGYSRSSAEPMAMKALERVGMESYANRKPFFLSGGEQQRIAVARAIINSPRLIIADEPTGNLDTTNGDMVTKLLTDYIAEQNGTIIMVTHNLEYLPLADHLLHIQDGKVEDLESTNYQKMTKKLMDEMKERIDVLAAKQHRKASS
jgi:ABC-type lipoprotein export system ATPase subunit